LSENNLYFGFASGWFLAKNKAADAKRHFRDRRKKTLFIDARNLGTLNGRVHRQLTDADLEKITSTYHRWQGEKGAGQPKRTSLAFMCVNGLQEHDSGVLGKSLSPSFFRESHISSYRAKFPEALAA